MSNSHPENGEFVGLPGKGGTGRDHIRELGDVGGHLVPPASLDLAMVLPTVEHKTKPR